MAKTPADPNKPKRVNKPAKPRTFYLLFKGNLDHYEISFDKDAVMNKLSDAMEAGDTSLKMKRLEVPRTSRAPKTNTAPAA